MTLSPSDTFSEVGERISRLARERGEKITTDEFASAIRLLHRKQFVFREDHPRQVEVLNRMSMQVKQYFAVLGARVVSDANTGMYGVLPEEGEVRINLSLEETAFLLCLRIIYEMGAQDGTIDDRGRVLTTFGVILETHFTKTRRSGVKPQLLEEAMDRFSATNVAVVVKKMKDAKNETIVAILPSIRFVTGSDFVSKVNAFVQNAEGAQSDDTGNHPFAKSAIQDEENAS